MRKTSVLILGALALVFIVGAGILNADVYTWSGTGTGSWYWGSFHGHPFQTWTAEVDEDVPYAIIQGLWVDDVIRLGVFWDSTWNGTVCTGAWTAVTTVGDGEFTIDFNFDENTCSGYWTSTNGYGSGTISGSSGE